MAIYTSEVVGLDALIDDFMELPEKAIAYMEIAADASAKIVHAKVKENAPVSKYGKSYYKRAGYNHPPGTLKKMIKMTKTSKRRKNKYFVTSRVYVGRGSTKEKYGAAYAVPLELGHKVVLFGHPIDMRVPPLPFMRPAADSCKGRVTEIHIEQINNALTDFGNK